MASNQLSDGLVKEIKEDLNSIFGRAVAFYKFPLADKEDQLTLARAWMPPELIESIERVLNNEHSNSMVGCYDSIMIKIVDEARDSDNTAMIVLHTDRDGLEGVTSDGVPTLWARVYQRLGEAKASAVETWVENVRQIEGEVTVAHRVLLECLRMANTGGQLRRMVPDLVSNLNPRIQARLSVSKRASSVPFAWSEYSRTAVETATTVLAKCKLLPVAEDYQWSERHSYTWLVNKDD